jgi:hypothetical protein
MQWFRNLNAAVSIIKLLVALAATSGGVMTLTLLSELRWYIALTVGAVFTAALLMICVGIDYFWRIYGIARKVRVLEVRPRSIRLNQQTNRIELELTVYVRNSAIVPVWIQFERVAFQVDNQTHPPGERADPMEVQPESMCSITPDAISLDPTKTQMEGTLEAQLKYGKKKNKIDKPYKTLGRLSVHVTHGVFGPIANVITIGGQASYD